MRLLGPRATTDTLALATFVVEGIPHALVAARLSAEFGIGVRHGCFCAHPYLLRLLGLSPAEVLAYREAVLAGDRRTIPGAVRASAGLSTSSDDVDRLITAVTVIASGEPPPVDYHQDPGTGDYWPGAAISRAGQPRIAVVGCPALVDEQSARTSRDRRRRG